MKIELLLFSDIVINYLSSGSSLCFKSVEIVIPVDIIRTEQNIMENYSSQVTGCVDHTLNVLVICQSPRIDKITKNPSITHVKGLSF